MAKQAGIGDNLYVAGYDLSGDVGTVQTISSSAPHLDVTGIDKSAHERLFGNADGEISFNSFFNDAAIHEHEALKGLLRTDRIVSYFRGTVQGGWTANMIGKQINYDWVRAADGSLIATVQALANGYGLEWGQSLTAGKRTDTTATAPATGTDVATTTGVSTAFGMAAYLQVFSFTGTSATMTIQDSADNSSFLGITGLSAFTAATGITEQRIETDTLARTIRRYLKVNTTGTFSECTFAVTVVRYAAGNRAQT